MFDILDVNSYVSKSLSGVSGRLLYACELTVDILDVNSHVSKSLSEVRDNLLCAHKRRRLKKKAKKKTEKIDYEAKTKRGCPYAYERRDIL